MRCLATLISGDSGKLRVVAIGGMMTLGGSEAVRARGLHTRGRTTDTGTEKIQRAIKGQVRERLAALTTKIARVESTRPTQTKIFERHSNKQKNSLKRSLVKPLVKASSRPLERTSSTRGSTNIAKTRTLLRLFSGKCRR